MNFYNIYIYIYIFNINISDPSAGSPTETLLRLLLPLNIRVCKFL